MIKCISYWSMPDGLAGQCPIEDALARATDAGFAGLELCVGTEGVLTPETPEAECEAIRRQVDASGFVVETLASGMSWAVNPTSNDAAVRDRAVELHAGALRRAAWLGCEAMLFVPGVVASPIAPDEKIRYDTAVERARTAVGRLLETAEEVGVDLCIENVWNGLFYSPLELADFVDGFGSGRLGVYFDAANVLGYHQWPPHWVELLGGRIKRVHVKGYRETFGWTGEYAFCCLGEGDVPWDETMAALAAVGYDRTLVAEMLPYSDGLLQQTSAAMDRILVLTP
ncbi:MAG: sugar phosphate isomerase/epimerase family protein [Phycisphaerae bacterium]